MMLFTFCFYHQEQALELYLNSNGKQVYKDSGSLAYTDLGIWDPSNETGWLMAGQKAQVISSNGFIFLSTRFLILTAIPRRTI